MEAPLVGDDAPPRALAPALQASARTRAAAVYYGFAMLSVGFLVVLAFTIRESLAWRTTLTTESAEWRHFVNATIHAMGLAAQQGGGGLTAQVDL